MGTLENSARRRLQRHALQRVVLGVVAGAGLLSMAVVAPNAIGALSKLGILTSGKRRKEIINQARDRLLKRGFLARNREGYLSLTARGETLFRRLELGNYKLKKPRRWDGKWRILTFDIPEHRRSVRNRLRATLSALGFKRLQDSVWIYPYPCEDFLALLKADLKIGKDLLYIISEEIEGARSLRAYFELPQE